MSGYVMSDEAESDLDEIARYSFRRWGAARANRYLDKLETCIERLVAGRAPFKDLSDLIPSLRMLRCEHHFIVYLPQDGKPGVIVALLHERMDLIGRLRNRLA